MPEFSDPAWWPKPPPKLPTTVSLPRIVFFSLVPLLAVGALVMLLHERRGHPAGASLHSVAAFESCTRSRKGQQAAAGSDRPATARASCAGLLPSGTEVGRFAPPDGRRGQFESCLENATSKLPRERFAGGGFARGPSAIFRAAVAVCGSLGQSRATTTARAPGGLPKA
jgi:hypothetical protein